MLFVAMQMVTESKESNSLYMEDIVHSNCTKFVKGSYNGTSVLTESRRKKTFDKKCLKLS